LKPALADIDQNKVLSGVRFVKKNRIIHIEIEQSQALPEGLVNDTDKSWISAPNDLRIGQAGDQEDVFEMSYENRALDIDILEAPQNHVITGLRFRRLGGHINLEARITPIDFQTGTLDSQTSTWIGHDKTQVDEEDRRTRVSIITPDIPTRFLGRNSIDSRNNQVNLTCLHCQLLRAF
jgi:hypothetical protein